MDQSETLYLQFLAGNEAALAQLIDAHKTGLTLFLAGYVKDEATAEELEQYRQKMENTLNELTWKLDKEMGLPFIAQGKEAKKSRKQQIMEKE